MTKSKSDEPVSQMAEWLKAEIAAAPPEITAVYAEWDISYSNYGKTEWVSVNAFGYKELASGEFSSRKRDHVRMLGDFDWESKTGCEIEATKFPDLDWTPVLKKAAKSPKVTAVVRPRNLLLIVGAHGDKVYIAHSAS